MSFSFFATGCPTEYRGDQVAGVCASGGMKPLSLDDPALATEFVIIASIYKTLISIILVVPYNAQSDYCLKLNMNG